MTGRLPTVLHVMGRLAAGGTERQLLAMLEAAHGRHWDARLLVLRPEGELVAQFQALDVPLTLGPPGSDASPGRLALLRREMAEVDCVHSQLHGANLLVRLAAASRRRRPAVVAAERRVEDWRSRPARLADRLTGRWCDAWIANSDAVAAFVADAHGVSASEVHVIRNATDARVFAPRADWAVRHPVRLGCVGRLIDQKGIDLAIEAVRLLRGRIDVELVVAGSGPDEGALRARAEGLPVTFTGLLGTPPEVAELLHDLDLFLFPSRYEGLPNALLEARACGVPAIATAAPGVTEAADAGTVLVAPEDPVALAAAIVAAVEHGLSRILPSAPRDFDAVAAEHLEVFRRAIQRRPQRGPRRHTP